MSHFETEAELKARLDKAAKLVDVGASYRHYKNMEYKVIALALIEESIEPSVVYRAEYGERITYVRPLSNWLETVEAGDNLVKRFAKI